MAKLPDSAIMVETRRFRCRAEQQGRDNHHRTRRVRLLPCRNTPRPVALTFPIRPICSYNGRFIMRTMVAFWLLSALLGSQAGATPFSYQGRLLQGGVPANGHYDLRFELFMSPTGLDSCATAITNAEVTVDGGIFTTFLDF